MSITKDQIKTALRATMAISEAVREVGTVPAGILYSVVMGHMDLAAFNSAVQVLKNAKLVEEDGSHRLTWIGPKPEIQCHFIGVQQSLDPQNPIALYNIDCHDVNYLPFESTVTEHSIQKYGYSVPETEKSKAVRAVMDACARRCP